MVIVSSFLWPVNFPKIQFQGIFLWFFSIITQFLLEILFLDDGKGTGK